MTPAPACVRVLPAPRSEPPYDDQVRISPPAARTPAQGTLALTFMLPGGAPAEPTDRPLRLVQAGPASPEESDEDGGVDEDEDEDEDCFERRPRPTSSALLPDPTAWVTRLAQAVVEVLGGTRPLGQLRRWTSDEVYAQLRRRSRSLRVTEPTRRDRGPGRPVRAVRAVRICEPADGIVEACAVVDDGRRARAVALRLEGLDGRWRLVAYEQR